MAENSKIEWTHHTFNPWIGCTKVHEGCKHCYAEADFDKRKGFARWGDHGTRVLTSVANWKKPKAWNKAAEAAGERHRVFCASLADVFEDWDGPIQNGGCWRDLHDARTALFHLIEVTPHLDWLLLTKRPENIRRMWPRVGQHDEWMEEGGDIGQYVRFQNVWLGTSISEQEHADKQIPELEKCRDLVPVLFLSCEPLLGLIDLDFACNRREMSCIDWVIAGGESGLNARPMHPLYPRSLRDQCQAAGVPFLFKQWGEFAPSPDGGLPDNLPDSAGYYFEAPHPPGKVWRFTKQVAGRMLDGQIYDEFPAVPL